MIKIEKLYTQKILKQTAQMLIDFTISIFAITIAFFVRFEGNIPIIYLKYIPYISILIGLGKTLLNVSFGLYKIIWHYASLHDAMLIFVTSILATLLLIFLRLLNLINIPLSVIGIDFGVYILSLGFVRVFRRIQFNFVSYKNQSKNVKRTIMIGAGETANALIKDLNSRRKKIINIICILDDDPMKIGKTIQGIPIVSDTTKLGYIIKEKKIENVTIAMPSANTSIVQSLINISENNKVSVQVIPSIEKILSTNGSIKTKDQITIDDLKDSSEIRGAILNTISDKNRNKRILVTGGAGFIGSHVVRKLLKKGYSVRVLDNFSYGNNGLKDILGNKNLEIVNGNIANISDVVKSVKDVRTVIALAAIVGDPACGIDAVETLNINYESTKIIAEICNFYWVERLVFASSCSVYGANNENDLLSETSPLNPISLYARTRIMSEDVIFERARNFTPVVLRLSTVFGLSFRMRYDLVVNTLTARAVKDGKIQIFGGDQWRPNIHCQDAADAFILAAEADDKIVKNQIFNVGHEKQNLQISEIGNLVANNIPNVIVENKGDIQDSRDYRVSFKKIRKRLGFIPKYSVNDGIVEIKNAIKNGLISDDYQNYQFSNYGMIKHSYEDETKYSF